MTAVAERADLWQAHFASQTPTLPWIEELRQAGLARFQELGFPTTRNENWKYTNVAPITRTTFEPAPFATVAGETLPSFTEGTRFIFVNGRLRHSATELPGGVSDAWSEDARKHLAQYATFKDESFVALNTAFLGDAACIQVDPGVRVEEPIHLVYVSTQDVAPIACHPRTLLLIGEGASCTIVETYLGTGSYLTNGVTEIVVGAGANVDHYKIQMESPQAFHVATVQAELGRDAHYATTSIALGGALVRNQSNVKLAEASDATLNGLYLAQGSQHVDNQLTVDHAAPNATSNELYKGILDGVATGAFNGKILVRKDAQKTDAKQKNQNLLLSDAAVINTKPELQILADDVRCTHGATIGQLDPEAAFYLQSRGIPKADAHSMLTYAFAQDLIDRIQPAAVRAALERIIFERLYARNA